MQYLIIGLLFSLLIFLFCLYALSFEDIVLIRRKIPTEQIFDSAIIILLIGLFFARLLYVLFHFTRGYLHPLVFLLFPYFPGLSMLGGIVGSLLGAFFVLRSKKMPTSRLIDMFSVSFLASLPVGYMFPLIIAITQKKHISSWNIILPVLYSLLLLLFTLVIFPLQRRNKIKEGTVTLFMLIIFTTTSILIDIFNHVQRFVYIFSAEDILFMIMLIGSIIVLLRHENILFNKKVGK